MTSNCDRPDAMSTNRNVPLRGIADTTKRASAPPTGLWCGRGRFWQSRIAGAAIVAFAFSISVCSMVAQTASQPEAPGTVHLTKAGRRWVAKTLRSLTMEEKIGQMLMGRCFLDYASFESQDYKKLRDDLQKYHIGSLVVAVHINQQGLVRPSPLDAASVTNQLQSDSKLPLLIAADLERGLASRLKNVPDFPWPMALGAAGDPAEAERLGAITARYPLRILPSVDASLSDHTFSLRR